MIAQRRVDRDASTEQGSDVFALEDGGDGDGEAPVDADGICIPAVTSDASWLCFGAEVFFALAAPLALTAGIRLPADTDAVADLDACHRVTGCGD